MTRLFANPLAGRPSAASCPHNAFPFLTQATRTNRVLVGTEREAKTRRCRRSSQYPVAKQQPLDRNLLRRCPPLVMRIATSIPDREQRLTDEAFRSQVGEPSAGSSGCLFRVSRLWHSEALLQLCCGPVVGAAERLGSIPARNLVGLGPQSKRFFACLNCGRLRATGGPGARGLLPKDRIAAPRPQGRPRQKVPRPRRVGLDRAPQR